MSFGYGLTNTFVAKNIQLKFGPQIVDSASGKEIQKQLQKGCVGGYYDLWNLIRRYVNVNEEVEFCSRIPDEGVTQFFIKNGKCIYYYYIRNNITMVMVKDKATWLYNDGNCLIKEKDNVVNIAPKMNNLTELEKSNEYTKAKTQMVEFENAVNLLVSKEIKI